MRKTAFATCWSTFGLHLTIHIWNPLTRATFRSPILTDLTLRTLGALVWYHYCFSRSWCKFLRRTRPVEFILRFALVSMSID